MTGLAGKRALVTGGARGIGKATVERLIADGVQVVACGRSAARAPEGAIFLQADVSNQADVDRLVAETMDRLGGIDILVNNAGVQIEKTVVDSTDEDWTVLMGTNAEGVFRMCRAAIPVMAEAGGGVIVNVGSISADHADPSMALYNASKAFVHGLTRSIAVDHGGQRIRCNAVCPGWIMTEMADAAFGLAKDPTAAEADAVKRTPAGRLGRPKDIADVIAWLASDESRFVTGQCYVADGGLTVATPLRPGLF
jgi:NAD(P)-dependent dehydrogenase (short-subunit alcohol dehydrogenase family)